ncbi:MULTISPECIES: UbiA family prenyltransferase [unclassified Streptomyces]|uniref:UbiA family prenyltransferase n=1 Tax=unclassified Streptomyces TaxID=2593676 RepID=UPI002DDC2D03|nr:MULTISPECIES: UbiA family prenyltransferase [unclassified Streptomyces]WSF88571.1 UbiA family prenyltransferase [Streptomyces sp. NBC_01744]WSC43596.1 UbiA family prenyltransferase [Streptomyces sp. NBC_01762]WSC57467.1 UbiA family prenyltransferase [Streptomyces sp. NBC_01761]WSD23132.1 UbiA family prenyltransferase [Streptomyces sp. NBC_01751]WSJ54809.1 UbiA family prenyltransferase [Streptomyces sp. NBC_01318]
MNQTFQALFLSAASPAPAPAPAEAAARAGGPGLGRGALALLLSAHPAPALAVTALITALAVAAGRDAFGSCLVALAVLTGQLSVGWSNDRIDLARDTAAHRRDKPLVAGEVQVRSVSVAACAALVLCAPLSLANGAAAGGAHLIGVAAGWSYNLGVKRTRWSWLPYALAFGLLPAFLTLALPGRPWPAAWVVAAGALLGVGAHFINVLPDIDADLAAGVRGLPQRLGRRRSRTVAALTLLAASAVLVLGPPGPPDAMGWIGLAVTGAPAVVLCLPLGTSPDSRLPFLATLGLAGADVALLVARGTALG